MGPAEPDSIILLMRSGQRFSPPPIRPQPACTATPRRVGALLAAMIGLGALPTLAQEATPVAATTLPLDLNLAATDAAPAPSSAASPPTLASEARTPGVGFEPPEPRLSYLLGPACAAAPTTQGRQAAGTASARSGWCRTGASSSAPAGPMPCWAMALKWAAPAPPPPC